MKKIYLAVVGMIISAMTLTDSFLTSEASGGYSGYAGFTSPNSGSLLDGAVYALLIIGVILVSGYAVKTLLQKRA